MITHRTSASIALSVWSALFLREAVSRISANRTAWIWLLLKPISKILFMILLFTTIRMRVVGGIDTPLWLASGLLVYDMFRETGMQTRNAVNSNKALFTYRQVKPIDTVISRAFLEGMIGVLVTLTLLFVGILFGYSQFPPAPLTIFGAFLGMWLVGIGFGLITSVLIALMPLMDKVINLLMMPVYLLSGVIFPVTTMISPPYSDWLLFNPLFHGVESIRLGFAPYYHASPNLSLSYLYFFALCSICFGLLLYRRYHQKIVNL